MSERPTENLDRAIGQLRELEARLDPDGVPTAHPWRLASRNSAIIAASVAASGFVRLYALRGYGDPSNSTVWWCLAGVAVLATATCFGHAALGFVVGRSAAANFLKIVLGVLMVGMIVWVVRETGGRGR